jgi:hypothetical protein
MKAAARFDRKFSIRRPVGNRRDWFLIVQHVVRKF